MSELYFRTGETEGFTSKRLADKKSGYDNPIRELLQNSLDASKDAHNEKCEINIYIESIKKMNIPHIDDYENTLKQAVQYHKSGNSYNNTSEQIVKSIQAELKRGELDVLMFVDNGKGMSPDILNGLIGERSVKSSEGSGGSFGVGHLSPYFLSSLRYVLYASKYENETLFSGAPILAGFEDKEASRSATGRILASIPDNPQKPKFIFPEVFPDFIQPKMDEIDTGSMVAILGLNTKWDKEANYAVVSNFFYAIYKDELSVNINRKGILISIESIDIERILLDNQDGKTATGDKILSNQDIYQLWLAVQDKDCKKTIELDNGDKVCAHIRNNIQTNSVIALVRNGMLIARHDKMLSNELNNLRKNEDFESFSIVINVDEKECPKLFGLAKGAESPHHDKLEKDRLIPKEEARLKELLKELCEKIKTEHLKEKDRDSFNLSMPLLEIPNKAEAQGQNASRPRSQTPKAKSSQPKSQQPVGKVKETNNGKKRPFKGVISRTLESKNAVRFKDNGDTMEVFMSVKPQKMDIRDDVYFSVSLAQDTDNNSIDSALELIKLSIDGRDVPMPDFIEIKTGDGIEKYDADRSQVKLGKLSTEQDYSIVATIEKPKKVRNIGVALKLFLGLKQGKRGEL